MGDLEQVTSIPRFTYYLALIEDTTKLSDRRQTTNDLFVGLNVVFFTGMGALIYTSHLRSWWVTGLFASITCLALVLNLTWIRLINRYRRLIGLRIRYMHQLEVALQGEDIFVAPPADESVNSKGKPQTNEGPPAGIFAVEASRLYRRGAHFGFSRLERGLIIVFMVAYVIATVGVAVATYLVTSHAIGPVNL